MHFQGKWHAEGSAAQLSAALHLHDERYKLVLENGEFYAGNISQITVSDRLGNIERKLTFEDGSIFATNDNNAIDKAFNTHNKISGVLHVLESHIGLVVVALVLTISFSFVFFKSGVPWISDKIAHALPQKTNDLIATNTLAFLDKHIFEESKLPADRIEQIRTRFQSKLVLLEEKNPSINYTLHFREWSQDGTAIANALALPSGDIILTDEFVTLSKNHDEIDSVLLHEIGHVVHRHTLETIIQATLVTTVVMMVTGDNNGLADLGTGIGSLLMSTNYSRNHETEADTYAFEQMLKAKIDPIAFSNIMSRITTAMESIDPDIEADDHSDEETTRENDKGSRILDYLSTHPSTTERVKEAERYSQCFHQGLITCEAVKPAN